MRSRGPGPSPSLRSASVSIELLPLCAIDITLGAPTFEVSDDRYAWLNTVQAVGRGQLDGSRLVYELAEVR